jgi:hypothetical protein
VLRPVVGHPADAAPAPRSRSPRRPSRARGGAPARPGGRPLVRCTWPGCCWPRGSSSLTSSRPTLRTVRWIAATLGSADPCHAAFWQAAAFSLLLLGPQLLTLWVLGRDLAHRRGRLDAGPSALSAALRTFTRGAAGNYAPSHALTWVTPKEPSRSSDDDFPRAVVRLSPYRGCQPPAGGSGSA